MAEKQIKAHIKLMIFDGDNHLMGPGGYRLLKAIQEEGSVKKATESLKMSYSKGWKILKGLESQFDCKLIYSNQGGIDGGRSELTPISHNLIHGYEKIAVQLEEEANRLLSMHLKESDFFKSNDD